MDIVVDDTTLRCVDSGQSGDTCLLIHGFGQGLYIWQEFAKQLSSRFRVIAVDLRGHGDSEWSHPEKYTFDTYASDIVAICRQLQLHDVTMIGHSMGAGVALRASALIPEVVRSLVLVDYGPFVNTPTARTVQAISQLLDVGRQFNSLDDYVKFLKVEHPMLQESVLMDLVLQSVRQQKEGKGFQLKCDPSLISAINSRQRSTTENSIFWSQLSQMNCPTLLVRGEFSPLLTGETARKMVTVLCRGELAEIPFAAHEVMLDNLHDTLGAVVSFIQKQDDGRCV